MAKYLAVLLWLMVFLLAACSGNNDLKETNKGIDILQEESVISQKTEDADHAISPESQQNKTHHIFNPYQVNVGDQIKSWTVTKIEDNYFNAPAGFSIMTSFSGEAEISGSFEYYYDDANYNAGDVIFCLDENSTLLVPIPEDYHNRQNTRVILVFHSEEEKALFGPPGTSGKATVQISDYQTLMAEAYGGVIDNAVFKQLINIESIPPDSPEKMNVNHLRYIEDFKPLEYLPEELIDSNGVELYDWLSEVSRTFNRGLQMDERRITEEQREEFKPWLQQIFTPPLTESLLDQNVPQVQGGYMVAGYLSFTDGLGPHSTDKHRFIQNDDLSYTYSVQLSGGANRVILDCNLLYQDGEWKIDSYSHQYGK